MCRLLPRFFWVFWESVSGCDVVEQVAKTTRNLFSKKRKILRWRWREVKRKQQSPAVVVKTSIFLSLSVSTHTPNSSLLFRTQWLLFPPPRYAYNAILFFSRSSAVRVGGSLPRFRPTRYFSPLIIENGCVPKKKKFLAPRKRGVIVNDDRKLRARQKRAYEFSSVSLSREILNATTDLKLSSETLTDYPTHAVLQGCRSVQEQDRRQGVFFFPSGESRYPLSLLVSVFFL